MIPTSTIKCHAVVKRMGEMFGEFGFKFDDSHLANDVVDATKWQLQVEEAGDAVGNSTSVHDEVLSTQKRRKVVKLVAGSFYLARVRVFSESTASWSAWSEDIRTCTLHSVNGRIDEIGEDYVRVLWNRPMRDTRNITLEENTDATLAVANISNLELRILRESDMAEEFCDVFATGVRSHTVYGLRPGTPYVIMIRYETLINTMKNWMEIARFFTRQANVISLESRGEDVVTVSWCLKANPMDVVGYIVPDNNVYRYEVSVEGEDIMMNPVELPADQQMFRMDGLSPGMQYYFYVRSLTDDGRWGRRSDGFKICMAHRPELSLIASGETFLSFTWIRDTDEPIETKVEYRLTSLTSSYKQQETVEIGSKAEDKVIHIQGLTAGTEYNVSVRTFLQNEWGLWTERKRFRTQSKASLTFLERGENFITVSLEGHCDDRVRPRFHVIVMRVAADGVQSTVLDEAVELEPGERGFRVDSLQANTVYMMKCRAWQYNRVTGYESWGEFTEPVLMQTLQHLAVQLWDIGEDFAQIVWHRDLSDTASSELLPEGVSKQLWTDLRYELVVGCLDSGEDVILNRQLLQTSYTITNLRPATTYIISVRACNELDQWGLWRRVKLRTLAPVETAVHEIGEDFVRLMWQRQLIKNRGDRSEDGVKDDKLNDVALSTADMFVSRYAVFVCSREEGESLPSPLSGYHMGGNSDVARYEVVTNEHTSLRVGDLLPDREYIAVVRASTATGKWGLWSEPLRFRSNSQFRIPVNNLIIGENYVNLVWSRDAHPIIEKDVFVGDLSVTGQQLRIQGVDTSYSKDHTLAADLRELKIYNLSPATAYIIQIRVCGKSGNWGLWSPPVHILTRNTILTKAVEVADDYAIISWERRKVMNPKNYPTGRGLVTSYHLRVYNVEGVHSEAFLGDGDSPYRISNLQPDTYYCVEIKANYNDEEWGLWSTPLWCLTMKSLEIKTKVISEEFCCITIERPHQPKRTPEDDGNRADDDRIIAFGQLRSNFMLCVTTPVLNPVPHSPGGYLKPRAQKSSLPSNATEHRLIYQTEIISERTNTDHTIPNLRSDTVYSVSVRSKLVNGEWGMWSFPPLMFATVPPTQLEFNDIGENFFLVGWKRSVQNIPPHIKDTSEIALGLGTISASRVKVREIGGSFQKMFEMDNSLTMLRVDSLLPTTTYGVAVQTCGDNGVWGVWSEEAKVRTIPGMDVAIHHISEDAVWVSWSRKSDISRAISFDTVLNTDVVARSYEVCITGDGHFEYSREISTPTFFFRGLLPDTVYNFHVRAQATEKQEWGLWATRSFHTKPRLRVTFGNVGEHFALVEWRRHLPSCLDRCDADTVVESKDVVHQFRLKVERVGDSTSYLYDLSPYISKFRLRDLQPSAEYRVWLCAKGFEGVWGFWNDEVRVRTLPKLEVEIINIGEDYVTVTWCRRKWVSESVNDHDGTDVHVVDGAVSGYRVRVLDKKGNEVVSQSIGFRESICKLSSLNLSTCYCVEVSAKDTHDEWGLWSDPKYFATLGAVDLNILRVGEGFVELEWGRRHELVERRRLCQLEEYSEEEGSSELSGYASASLNTTPLMFDEKQEAFVCSSSGKKELRSRQSPDGSGNEAVGDAQFSDDQREEEDDMDLEFLAGRPLMHGDDGVMQWHIQVECKRVFGGQPGADDFLEFYASADELGRIVDCLQPNAEYVVTVRAQDKNCMWGHWSEPHRVVTCPLLQLNAESITETFINVSWTRPPIAGEMKEGYCCYPTATEIHNYQVHIKPLSTEEPFDERDEPLVDGARIYETSQPSLRLCNLTPGARYRVVVREQLVDRRGAFMPETWGCFSGNTVVEMVHAMGVVPIEIGENYCLIGWRRVPRTADMTPDISIVKGMVKVTAYELRATRLDNKAMNIYEGPLALNNVVALDSTATSYHLGNLVSNTIYSVSVRARAEGCWGPWSAPTKFVSQDRLKVKVHSVFEDVVFVSWSRPLPDWARSRREAHGPMCTGGSPGRDSTSAEGDGFTATWEGPVSKSRELTSLVVDKEIVHKDPVETTASANDDLASVQLGDYSIDRYELYIEGITCEMRTQLILPKYQMSVRIKGLQPDHIYSLCVRSQSAKKHWSMLSRRVSVLTLTSMRTEVVHCTETMAEIRWLYIPQDVSKYEAFLQERRMKEEQRCDERERHELFDMKRRLQELEDSDERENLRDHLELRHEHNAAARMDAVHHLRTENIIVGKTDVSGYHLRLHGEGTVPTIYGIKKLLLPSHSPKARGGKRKVDVSKHSVLRSKRHVKKDNMYVINVTGMGSEPPSPSLGVVATQQTFADEGQTTDDTVVESSETRETSLLLDLQFRAEVSSVIVRGLSPSSSFKVEVRARNIVGDWCPWSQCEQFRTLKPIELHHERFGEHFISLYWYRLPQSVAESMEADEKHLVELNDEFATMSQKDLEDKKRELSEEDYKELLAKLKSWCDLKQRRQKSIVWLAGGHGEVVVADNTPIKGYQLRVIHEDGTFKDYYIDEKDAKEGEDRITCSFTVTGLVWNTLYTAMLCCDYGIGWGPWTEPLKFITQNLIQLSITYISEVFVDIEWHRAPNKRLPPLDEGTTLVSNAASVEGCVCQVRLEWEDEDGQAQQEYRTMHSCCVFRVDKLLTDTKYTFAVREWGAEGDWGLWCTPKTCVTVPGMYALVEKLGENWASVFWDRRERRVDYDNDMNVLQYGVEKVSYYLRVLELQDNGVEGEVNEVAAAEDGHWSPVTMVDEMAGIFNAERQMHGPLPPQEHPLEYESDGSGRLHLTRRFSKETSSFLVENLRPDRFYSVQVLCETTGGQLGAWSTEQYFLTMSKIEVTAEHIDEQYSDISWRRAPPRQHPRLNMDSVFVGRYVTVSYKLEVRGRDGLEVNEVLYGSDNATYHLAGLNLDTVYSVRVLSINDESAESLWSEAFRFVTLNRITVSPTQITEHSIMLEWGREEQRPTGDEEVGGKAVYDPTICVRSAVCSSYQLRIILGSESGSSLLLEKHFSGDICTFHLQPLTPNTPYLFYIRATNQRGQWGLWSEERCVYTMKLITAEVLAVGEDYVRLHWKRHEPDELQVLERVRCTARGAQRSDGDNNISDETVGNQGSDDLSSDDGGVINDEDNSCQSVGERTASCAGSTDSVGSGNGDDVPNLYADQQQQRHPLLLRTVRRKKYPLLDRPEVKGTLYRSVKTTITTYAVLVIQEGGGEGYTVEVPGDSTTFTVPSLRPDMRYILSIRACYGSGEWGPSSPSVTCGTLNLLNVELLGLGEDYLTATWQRLPNSFDASEVCAADVEEAIAFELAAHDFTDVPFGEEDTVDIQPRLSRIMMLPAKLRSCTVKELLSHHRYRVSVRRWYKPHEAFLNSAVQVELPNIEDENLRELLLRSRAEPGTWSEGLYDVTLRDMVCTMDDGAEDSFVVHWERDPRAPPLPVRNPFPQKPVDGYQIRIDEMGPNAVTVDTSDTSLHIDQPLSGSETSYTARNLRPDALYRVEVRSCVDNAWGRWSRSIFIMTLPKLVVVMNSIGEDHAEFTWQRPRRSLLLPDETEALCGNDDNICKFQVEVVGIEHSFHVNKQFKATRNSYRVKQLEADTVYSVSVRSSDSRRDSWSLWSEKVLFATLKPMRIIVSPPGEQFVTVEWLREEQSAQEYADVVGGGTEEREETNVVTRSPSAVPVQLGCPDVIAYHLCVFAGQHTPSPAIVDKQFPKDVTRYCVCSLAVDTPYVVVVRACNTQSRWGLWSREGLFRTQQILHLNVITVGESYVHFKWERREGERADARHTNCSRLEPTGYQLLLKTGTDTIERMIKPEECGITEDDYKLPTYMLAELSPASDYLMALQPYYDEGRWGQWTPTVTFRTLHPIFINLDHVGCDRVLVSLGRTVAPASHLISDMEVTVQDTKSEKSDKSRKSIKSIKSVKSVKSARSIRSNKGVKSAKASKASKELQEDAPQAINVDRLAKNVVSSAAASAAPSVHGKDEATNVASTTKIEAGEGEEGSIEHKPIAPSVIKYQLIIRKTDESPQGVARFNESGPCIVGSSLVGEVYKVDVSPAKGEQSVESGAVIDHSTSTGVLPPIKGVEAVSDAASSPLKAAALAGSDGPQSPTTLANEPLSAGFEDHISRSGNGTSAGEINGIIAVAETDVACLSGAMASTTTDQCFAGGSNFADFRQLLQLTTTRGKPYLREMEFDVAADEPPVRVVDVGDLEGCTSYTIMARAMDTSGLWGNWIDLVVMTAPHPPKSVSLRRQNAQFCLLQWEAPDYRHSYRYVIEQAHYATDARGRVKGGIEWRVTDVVEEMSYRVRFTAPPAKMRCRIKCTLTGDSHLYSEYCEPVALTSTIPPDPVTDLVITEVSRNSVSLQWKEASSGGGTSNANTNRVLKYRIYIAAHNHTPILAATVDHPFYTFEGLELSTNYTIQVVTESSDGISYNNPIINVLTKNEGDNVVLLPTGDSVADNVSPDIGAPMKRVTLPDLPSTQQVTLPRLAARSRSLKTNLKNVMTPGSSGHTPVSTWGREDPFVTATEIPHAMPVGMDENEKGRKRRQGSLAKRK